MAKTRYLALVPEEAKPWLLIHSPLFWQGASLLLVKNPRIWFKRIKFWLENTAQKRQKQILKLIPELTTGREGLSLLSLLKENQNCLIVAPIKILEVKLPAPQELEKAGLVLEKGEKINLPKLIGFLLSAGYQKEKRALIPGNFARRGNILEIFPFFQKHCIWIELFGNKVETIRSPKNNNEALKGSLHKPAGKKWNNRITILPARIKKPQGSILDWLAPQARVILNEPENLLKNKLKQNLIIFQAFPPSLNRLRRTSPPKTKNSREFQFKNPPLFFGNQDKFWTAIRRFKKNKYRIFVSTKKLKKENLKTDCSLIPIKLQRGFQNDQAKVLVLTDTEIFGHWRRSSRQPRYQIDYEFIAGLVSGMHVVHLNHGIGLFRGMVQKEINGITREYYLLEYAQGDKLFLPIDQADRIARYLGRANPPIHRLHGALWHQIKRQVEEDAKKMAEELLKIQAKRQTQKGFVFGVDTPAQRKFENSFPYPETPDQEKAIQKVKKDMESDKPMDRLICGDVGFGKTEIAMRAAFKALNNGKQVCLLAPTTILAQQHLGTFRERFKKFSSKIELLSRFQSKSEQKRIVKKLSQGKIEIIIGTHRLLSRDVNFENLGLLIIDEEQRFGVRHKEKLKQLRANLDILTLSATPIPRTLHLALSGLREVSPIKTPPAGRKSVKTYVKLRKDDIIKKAIDFELKRKGQVYYLYNKVETILAQAKKIQKLAPRARIDIAHGRLSDHDLSSVMHEFDQGRIDILVATTIIENGLDLPNVNTLIVHNSPNFGLSQLYQIRGRIGRGTRQAYAYLLYQREKLPANARERLSALLALQGLGSGFNIALRDLEIRGAGNILGRKQSGSVNSVGLHLYTELLKQTISELTTGKKAKPVLEVSIDLPLPARIPPSFISSEKKRLTAYHCLSRAKNFPEIRRLKNKIEGKYGLLPLEFKNLFEILKIKILARRARIKTIDTINVFGLDHQSRKRIVLDFVETPESNTLDQLFKTNPAWIISETEGPCRLKIDFSSLGKNWLKKLKQNLKILAN